MNGPPWRATLAARAMTALDDALAQLRTADANRRHAAFVCADLLADGYLREATRWAQEFKAHCRQADAAYAQLKATSR